MNMIEIEGLNCCSCCLVLFCTTNLKANDNVCIILNKLVLDFIIANFYLEGEHETGSES